MIFNSYTFLLFFLVVLVVYFSNLLHWRGKKVFLLVASYFFYAAWNPPFVVLLLLSTCVDWWAARLIDSSRSNVIRRCGLFVTFGVNLGLLGFFKYGGFFLDNLIRASKMAGVAWEPVRPDIILPLGISFYTFQTLSYTIDVYRKKRKPSDSVVDFALYVSFFPQLVAGPIVRAGDFLPQCVSPKRVHASQFSWGLNLFLLGLFQKIVVADSMLASVVDATYDPAIVPNMLSAWMGTLAFAGQIFCDFSGYSTCAIGVAMCLGFALPDNFRFPYAAIGFSDFWNRWHISLSTWLRDYLYIPLGGNRGGKARTLVNLMVTMLLGGLWHGASWTFIAWGALHGVFLIVERILHQSSIACFQVWQKQSARLFFSAITFLLVCVAWVFFRARDFTHAFTLYGAMFQIAPMTPTFSLGLAKYLIASGAITSILLTHWFLRERTLEDTFGHSGLLIRSVANAIMITSIITMHENSREFIYFQF